MQRWAHVIASLPPVATQLIAPVMLARSVRRQARAGVPRPATPVVGTGRIPIIGLAFLREVKRGRITIAPAVERFTATGVRFAGGREAAYDTVILATGYRPALGYLSGVIPLDGEGRPHVEGVRSVDAPDLYFVGMHYDIRGTLFNIAHEAPEAARLIAATIRA